MVISCAVGTISLSPEAVWQLAVCRCFTAHSSVAGVIHQIQTCFTAHSSVAGVIHQIQTCFTAHSSVAGVIHQIQTCFTAHSSGAGVIHQIQTCFTAHRSGACVIPQIQTCFTAHQCGRCQLACARVLTAVRHVSSIRFRHASLLTSEWQVSAGTCFTAHSSAAGVSQQIQACCAADLKPYCKWRPILIHYLALSFVDVMIYLVEI